MMSTETVALTTRSQTYDKALEKKDEGPSSEKTPLINPSPPPSYNGPLTIETPSFDTILCPLKSTIRKNVFNPSARAAQFYNVVEDLTQEPCAISTLEVLQSCPTQHENFLSSLGDFDPDNSTMITFNVENYKSRLSHQLCF